VRVGIDARDAVDPSSGGWGRYVRFLIQALRRVEGIELIQYSDAPAVPELVFEQFVLPRRLARDGVDLVHAPNCFLPLHRPCAGVVSVQDLAFETHPGDFSPATGWKYRHFTPRSVESAERVIVPSEATRAALVEHYEADEARIRVVPYASALEPMPEDGTPSPPKGGFILVVGEIREKKNVGRLLRAHALARERGLAQRLVLAGRGAIDAGENVEVLGWVDDARLDRLYREADFLVYPSLCEGFGLAAVEAMERGCPVCLARGSSLPEVGGEAGVYFDPESVDDMAAAILKLGTDEELRASMARAGRERAARFTWDRSAELTAAVYAEAIRAGSE
jgi:glycosyltransferase involved in cell wall biosynthesis